MPKNPSLSVPTPDVEEKEKQKKKKELQSGFLSKFLSGEIGNQNEKKRINKPEGITGTRG